VAEVVEPVDRLAVGVDEPCVAECGLLDAPVEVRRMEWPARFDLEEQFVGGVDSVFDCARAECVECGSDGGEDRDRTDAGAALWSFELVARVGAFDVEESRPSKLDTWDPRRTHSAAWAPIGEA
jgi:hypothetical protein